MPLSRSTESLAPDFWKQSMKWFRRMNWANAVLEVERQVPVRIEYEGMTFTEGFRADLVVEGKAILELKSVEHTSAAHKKQSQTYLRLTGC